MGNRISIWTAPACVADPVLSSTPTKAPEVGTSPDASSSSTTKIRCPRVGYDGREGAAVEPQRPHAYGRRSPELMRSLGAGGFGVFRLGEFFRELVKLGL